MNNLEGLINQQPFSRLCVKAGKMEPVLLSLRSFIFVYFRCKIVS